MGTKYDSSMPTLGTRWVVPDLLFGTVSGPSRFIQKVPNPPRRATTLLGGYVRRGTVTMVGGTRTRVGV